MLKKFLEEHKMGLREDEIRKKIKSEERPWGNFIQYVHNENCSVKIITVDPDKRLSKQAHKQRDELWVVLDEGLEVELDDKVLHPKPGDEIFILKNTKHRLLSRGEKGRVLEISFGHFDENDIVRFHDDYDRK